jgi:histidinol-phosphate aminotransferase
VAEPPFNERLKALPRTVPFVGPETIAREDGVVFKARLGANESAFGISPEARKAIWENSPSFYGDPTNFDLRVELAERNGIRKERVLVGAGIDGLFALLCQAFVDAGTPVVTSQGSYPTFNYFATRFGAAVTAVPYKGWETDLDALSRAAAETEAPLVYLANPDNPTGTFHKRAAVEAFLAGLPEGCVPLLDEAYCDFAPAGETPEIESRAIRLRTFSKAHGMAGMRVGYLIADEAIVEGLNKIRVQFEVNRLAQIAALASLGDPGFLADVVVAVAVGREDYYALGKSLALETIPSATNFVSFDLETPERVRAAIDALKRRGVFVRTGPPPNDRLLRVTVGKEEQRALFAEALKAVLPEL